MRVFLYGLLEVVSLIVPHTLVMVICSSFSSYSYIKFKECFEFWKRNKKIYSFKQKRFNLRILLAVILTIMFIALIYWRPTIIDNYYLICLTIFFISQIIYNLYFGLTKILFFETHVIGFSGLSELEMVRGYTWSDSTRNSNLCQLVIKFYGYKLDTTIEVDKSIKQELDIFLASRVDFEDESESFEA